MFPIPCWSSFAIVDVRVLLDSINAVFEAINWAITSLSEKSAIARLSSAEEKYCCYSESWLAFWKPDCLEFKQFYSLNLLYSNTKNNLKFAHVFFAVGFLRQSLQAYVYIPEDITTW